VKAYYNEHDPKAAAWLRELIKQGHIADGDVDERSIEDVVPTELAGYTQCHFFAGIGVWSYALRRAGWPDDRPVWTGSCPCQPFSAAGKAGGFDDERHLWPAFHYLIGQRKPARVFGEQVASKDADAWIDLVQTDLEALGYAVGAVPFPSAGVGAPHIRDRLYWVADDGSMGDAGGKGLEGFRYGSEAALGRDGEAGPVATTGQPCGVADLHIDGREQGREGCAALGHRPAAESNCRLGGMADANSQSGCAEHERESRGRGAAAFDPAESGRDGEECGPGPVNGFWRSADWLLCRDGKWRPVEPGTLPLVNGAPARVGRLRGYGNAVNAKAAQAFIEAYLGVTS